MRYLRGKEPEMGKGRVGAAVASVVEAGEIHLHDPALIADAAHLQDHVDRGLKVSDDLAETELGALSHD